MAESWYGVRVANKTIRCIQMSELLRPVLNGEEDCLYLDVYVPKLNRRKALDVVIHIHGGSFIAGYGSEYTSSKYIMDRDLIFVTIQYRVAALGL